MPTIESWGPSRRRGASFAGLSWRCSASGGARSARSRIRPLEGAYPYLWLDAKHVKVRDRGRVLSKALVIAYGVHESGRREVIGLDLGEIESEAFWIEFLRGLRSRGLTGPAAGRF